MSEEKNNEVFLRPRFKIESEFNKDELVQKFKANLNNGDCKYCSKIVDNHIFIDVPFDEDHYWSPQLHVEVVKDEGATFVKGLFGPKPQVWTMFMFLHFAVGTLFSIFLVMFYVKWTLNSDLLFSTLMVIVLPIIWIALYITGRWGKKRGKEQMEELHEFMMHTLKRN